MEQPMTYFRSVAGALAIMAASGMIADFDVFERDEAIHVRVWSPDGDADRQLHGQVAAVLSRHVDGARIVVVRTGLV